MMKRYILSLVAILSTAIAGTAQVGVQAYGHGCTWQKRVPLPTMSLTTSPKLGAPIVWRWDNVPHVSNACPTAPGAVVLGVGRLPGSSIPGWDASCKVYVPIVTWLPVVVPMCNGPKSRFWLTIPRLPQLPGFKFTAQTFGWPSLPQPVRWSTDAIEVTIQN